MTPYARRTLNRFESAIREHEMKGALHPSDHEEIEFEYKQAKLSLEKLLNKEKSCA